MWQKTVMLSALFVNATKSKLRYKAILVFLFLDLFDSTLKMDAGLSDSSSQLQVTIHQTLWTSSRLTVLPPHGVSASHHFLE